MKFSGKKINRAGDLLSSKDPIANSIKYMECVDILAYWRSIHEQPLELAFVKLQEISRKHDKKAIFAKAKALRLNHIEAP